MLSCPSRARRVLLSCPSRARRVLLSSLNGHIIFVTVGPRSGCQVKTMSETHRKIMSCPSRARRVLLSCLRARRVLLPSLYEHIIFMTVGPRSGCQVKTMNETHRKIMSFPSRARRVLLSCPRRARRVLLPSLYGHIIFVTGRPRSGYQVKTMSKTHHHVELPR
jgi:hypothetical protein